MIGNIMGRVPRRLAFLGLNAAVVALSVLFVIAPLVERFSDRAAAIAQDAVDLARQQALRARALALVSRSPSRDDPFLPGHDAATADADLQQILEALAGRAGVRFVRVRGLGGDPARPGSGMVTARLDVEGSLGAIAALVQSIETQSPCLFVSALTMRTGTTGPSVSGDTLDAQLSVLGAFDRPTVPRGD